MTVARGQPTELDRRFMAAAIALGWRNAGVARPHPSVGAILVRKAPDGFEVIARAVSAPGGRPHAEALVLAAAGARARAHLPVKEWVGEADRAGQVADRLLQQVHAARLFSQSSIVPPVSLDIAAPTAMHSATAASILFRALCLESQ